jgi:cell wall-associated NlpC family hydrolase
MSAVGQSLVIPDEFWDVPYDGVRFPGAPGVSGPGGGANCQLFAYELLRHNGFVIGDLRSSELWDDTEYTTLVDEELAPGDLLLFHNKPQAWGAHVTVYLGEGRAIHLARRVGRPATWTLADFAADPLYISFIGAKRPIRRSANRG